MAFLSPLLYTTHHAAKHSSLPTSGAEKPAAVKREIQSLQCEKQT
jgi:hypothetical protein